jgi:hypothetical protein
VPVAPPESGFYIVDQEEYPNGFPVSADDIGEPSGPELVGVGYLLSEGSQVYAPFDGDFDPSIIALIFGQEVPAGLLFSVNADGTTGDIMFGALGGSIAFVESGPKKKGDILGVVTSSETVIDGVTSPINALILLSSVNPSTNAYDPNAELLHEFFSYLP